MALTSVSTLSMILIFTVIYLWQGIWIYRDCKRRSDELLWIWCILSLISFPIVLIAYIIFTRYGSREINSSTMREKRCGNCGFAVDSGWNYCPNCNHNLQSLQGSNISTYSNRSFGTAIIIFIAGIAAFTVFLSYGIIGIKNSFQKVTAPGSSAIYLKDSGRYTVFYEYEGDEENQLHYSEAKKLKVTLTESNSNTEVPIKKISGNINYSFGGGSGKSFLQFNIDKPGNYKLTAINEDAGEGTLTFAIANEFIKRLLIIILGSIVILFGTISMGVFIIISAVRKRRDY